MTDPSPAPLFFGGAAAPRWSVPLSWLLLLLGLVRGFALVSHEPLLALANNFDQVRYTACFDLYPDRPPEAGPEFQSPSSHYRFERHEGQACYLTSDLAFQSLAVGLFRLSERAGGGLSHSVRTLGMLRLVAWLIAVALALRAFVRDGRDDLALALAAWFVLLGLDPVNSLYLNTFYAEGGTLFFAFATTALCALNAVRASPMRWTLLALAAAGLAASKMQHLLLPLLAAAGIMAAGWRQPRSRSIALALLVGGIPALGLQTWQMGRDGAMAASIRLANNTDFVLTSLLPASSDPALTAQRMHLGAGCAEASGRSIYTLDRAPEVACPGIGALARWRLAELALREPATLARLLLPVPAGMVPVIPQRLGVVEGARGAALPAPSFSLDSVLGTHAILAAGVLAAPLLGLAMALWWRRGAVAVVFATMTATLALAVPLVAVLGDGLVELDKHAHLALNAGAAFLLACGVSAGVRRRHPAVKP